MDVAPRPWNEDCPTRQRCVVCSSKNSCRAFFMTHGVCVHLCAVHRQGNYLRRDGGRVFARDLRAYWRSVSGTVRPWCEAAAATHLLRVTGRLVKDGPGSYSWDGIRFHAESRFAAGEPPNRVIAELRSAHAGGHARVPALRTMRRWFFEGRWLIDPRVLQRRFAQGMGRSAYLRDVYVEESDLGMCIFRPTLAWARGVNLGAAVNQATANAKLRLARLTERLRQ